MRDENKCSGVGLLRYTVVHCLYNISSHFFFILYIFVDNQLFKYWVKTGVHVDTVHGKWYFTLPSRLHSFRFLQK
jgi:hypothetical protein